MSSATLHKAKYEHNKMFIQEGMDQKNKENYLDWYVTATFYASIHLIEWKLIESKKYTKPATTDGHRERAEKAEILLGKEVKEQLVSLRGLSQKARYDCYDMGGHDAYVADKNLSELENLLRV